MKTLFELFVKFKDQKFDVYIFENKQEHSDKFELSFGDIYPKIKEVVEIGTKEKIDFKTHDFELFEQGQSVNGTTIVSYTHLINQRSVICVKSKTESSLQLHVAQEEGVHHNNDNNERQETLEDFLFDVYSDLRVTKNYVPSVLPPLPSLTQLLTSPSDESSSKSSLELIAELKNCRQEVKDFHSIVLAINIGWNFRRSHPRELWQKVSKVLKESGKNIKAKKCKYIWNTWFTFYVENYYQLEGKMDDSTQQTFNYLKVVHTLDLDQLFNPRNKSFRECERIRKTPENMDYFQKHLKQIRHKKVKEKEPYPKLTTKYQPPPSTNNKNKTSQILGDCLLGLSSDESSEETNNCSTLSNKETKLLKKCRQNVEDFHSMVLVINIGWNFRVKKSIKVWHKVSNALKKSGKQLSANECQTLWYFWYDFYVKNYDKLEAKMDASTQEIFNYLKVIHTLDLDQLFNPSNESFETIDKITRSSQHIQYFNKHLKHIRDKKVNQIELDPNQPSFKRRPHLDMDWNNLVDRQTEGTMVILDLTKGNKTHRLKQIRNKSQTK